MDGSSDRFAFLCIMFTFSPMNMITCLPKGYDMNNVKVHELICHGINHLLDGFKTGSNS